MIPAFSPVNVPTRMTEDASSGAARMQRLMSSYARRVEKIGKAHGEQILLILWATDLEWP